MTSENVKKNIIEILEENRRLRKKLEKVITLTEEAYAILYDSDPSGSQPSISKAMELLAEANDI